MWLSAWSLELTLLLSVRFWIFLKIFKCFSRFDWTYKCKLSQYPKPVISSFLKSIASFVLLYLHHVKLFFDFDKNHKEISERRKALLKIEQTSFWEKKLPQKKFFSPFQKVSRACKLVKLVKLRPLTKLFRYRFNHKYLFKGSPYPNLLKYHLKKVHLYLMAESYKTVETKKCLLLPSLFLTFHHLDTPKKSLVNPKKPNIGKNSRFHPDYLHFFSPFSNF